MSNWNADQPKAKKEFRVGIVAAQFNNTYADALLGRTLEGLIEYGLTEETIDVIRVPGSFELPFVAKKLMDSKSYDGIICLGVIIRGDTLHFNLVADNTARGLTMLNTKGKIPVIFGVLACENKDQAQARIELGLEHAKTMVEMMNLQDEI